MASDLTEDQKLVMLGMRSPNQQTTAQSSTITTFKENVAEEWDTFQENFEDANLSDWAGFETWLTNNGVSADTASKIRSSLESKYPTFGDYSDVVLNATSWEEYQTNFKAGSGLRSTLKTQDGQSIAGVQVYEEGGVGRAGQSIPAGGVEIYGTNVHFSQSSSVGGEQEPAEDQSANPITYANLSVTPDLPAPYEDITVSADVTNNTNIPGFGVVAELIVDGSVEKTKTITVDANSTTQVSFTIQFDIYEAHEVTIADLPPESVVVVHPNLTGL